MEKEIVYYVRCPLQNGCLVFKGGFCGTCEECLAPVGFIKGGDNSCELCDECLKHEPETY